MRDKPESDFSAAFDALLDKNRQRLEALYGGSSKASTPAPRSATVAADVPVSAGRKFGRCKGKDFSFDI